MTDAEGFLAPLAGVKVLDLSEDIAGSFCGSMAAVPVIPANAVDPTGAGDAFRGGLIKGLAQGADMKRAVQMGVVCGYYAVQTNGTQTYRYTLDEFEAKLREHFG